MLMSKSLTVLLAAALFAAPVAHAGEEAADRAPPAKAPSMMTPTEISAHNVGLAQSHPYYVKCRKTLEIGSLVKKSRVCHTNAQWKEVNAKGNQNARDTAEAMTSKAGSGSN